MTETITEQSTLDRFVDLTRRKRALDAELRKLKKEIEPLAAELLDTFAEEGVRSKTTSDGCNVHIKRQIWARAATPEDAGDEEKAAAKAAAAEALRAIPELADYARFDFNTTSLSAYFRENAKRQAEVTGTPVTDLETLLPPALVGLIALTEDFSLGLTTS